MYRLLISIFGVILALCAPVASADKVIIGGVSHHFIDEAGSNCGFNEKHPAIGVERNSWELGFYYNSIENVSLFFTKIDRPWYVSKSISAGYRLGLANGYRGKTECEKGSASKFFKKETVNKDGSTSVTYYTNVRHLEDNFDNYHGFFPIAQALFTYSGERVTTDLGIGVVSTLTFKLNF